MAIQNRRGDYSDFDPQKMVPGEWAVVLSGDPNSERGKAVYMAFDVGDIERMATYEDMQENITSATSTVQQQFTAEVTQTISDANNAVTTMREDVDNEIELSETRIAELTVQANTAISTARNATAQANDAAETAYNAADSVQAIIDAGDTVASWNGRAGLVVPQAGDYNSTQITHNNTTVADALVFDSAPVANSSRAIQSGGVFAALGDTPLGTDATTISGAIAEHGTDISDLITALNQYKAEMEERLKWKPVENVDYKGMQWVLLPENANEVFVSVFISRNANVQNAVDFIIPVNQQMFLPESSNLYTHLNLWGTTNSGLVRVQTWHDNSGFWVRLYSAFSGDTNIVDNTYFRVYYR